MSVHCCRVVVLQGSMAMHDSCSMQGSGVRRVAVQRQSEKNLRRHEDVGPVGFAVYSFA